MNPLSVSRQRNQRLIFRRDAAHANFSVEIQLKIHYNIAGAAMPCLAGICPN